MRARADFQEWNRYQSRLLPSLPFAPTACDGSVEVSECRGKYICGGTTRQYTHQVCRLQPGVAPEKPAVCFTTEIAQFDVRLCRWSGLRAPTGIRSWPNTAVSRPIPSGSGEDGGAGRRS